jgi:quinol monooxygenase YgiN
MGSDQQDSRRTGIHRSPSIEEKCMKHLLRILPAFAVAVAGFVAPARADDPNTAYVVTYFETMPVAKDQARKLVRQLGDKSRNDEGNLSFEVLVRYAQPNHFAILEAWRDKDAQTAHIAATHTKEFREKLTPLLRSPYDERAHTGLSVDAMRKPPAGTNAVYVVTHVDIVPAEKDKGIGFVRNLAESSRNDNGNVRFAVLQQNSRPNHLTVVEVWKDRKALDAHGVSEHTRQFREKLTPLSGSLYDERLYQVIRSAAQR